ncbi:MAG: GNAT family N-acetyltransferase, partial [Bdellovibrionota bacterium]
MKSRKPELDKIKIRHLTLAERHLLPEILDLLNRTQGQGLFNTAYVEKFINTGFLNEETSSGAKDKSGRDNCKGRMFLAFENNQPKTAVTKPATHDVFSEANLIGAAGAELISNYDYYLPFEANLNEKFAGKIVGSFATMTVHEKYQGQGIGQKLSQARLNWLKEMKADYIIGVSWVSGLKHTSARVFEK